jgi:hypothetical protein
MGRALPLSAVELVLHLLTPDPVFELDPLLLRVLLLQSLAKIVAKSLLRELALLAELVGQALIALGVGLTRSSTDGNQQHQQAGKARVYRLLAHRHRNLRNN